MSVVTIRRENFQDEVLRSEQPVLLDFWAPLVRAVPDGQSHRGRDRR